MSLKTVDNYNPLYDQDSVPSSAKNERYFTMVSAEFAETDISAVVKENSNSSPLEKMEDEEKTTDTSDATISSPDIGNEHTNISFNFIDSSSSPNCRYANEQTVYETENVTDACDEVTTESLTMDSELSPNENICWAGNEESSTSPPHYVNALPIHTHAQSTSELDIVTSPTISYPRHNPTADVSLAFEMVDDTSAPPKLQNPYSGYVCESGSSDMCQSGSGYVCDSSSAYVYESELKDVTTMTMLDPENDRHADASGPVKHLSLEYLHLPSGEHCEGMNSFGQTNSYSSGYLSEEHAKSRYMPRETVFSQQSSSSNPSLRMTHRVRDLGDGYVDVMASNDSD